LPLLSFSLARGVGREGGKVDGRERRRARESKREREEGGGGERRERV
jgi:hypothetical protein